MTNEGPAEPARVVEKTFSLELTLPRSGEASGHVRGSASRLQARLGTALSPCSTASLTAYGMGPGCGGLRGGRVRRGVSTR